MGELMDFVVGATEQLRDEDWEDIALLWGDARVAMTTADPSIEDVKSITRFASAVFTVNFGMGGPSTPQMPQEK